MGPALASTTRLDIRPKNARYVPVFKERVLATMPGRFKSLCVCADHSEVRFAGVFCSDQGTEKRRWHWPMSFFATPDRTKVVGLGGLEPPASPLSGARSNHLSYRPNVFSPSGGACRDRTDDPLLAKQVLSQLS